MKRCSSASCLEDVTGDIKRVKKLTRDLSPDTKEHFELVLARILELQREIKEDTETDSDNSDLDASCEDDLTKEILAKVFQDLPEASTSIANIMDREKRREIETMKAIHNKKIQLLGFDTCRRMTVDYMKKILQIKSASVNAAEPEPNLDVPQQNEPADENDRRKQEALQVRTRMFKNLDQYLATKQKDFTSKLMSSSI